MFYMSVFTFLGTKIGRFVPNLSPPKFCKFSPKILKVKFALHFWFLLFNYTTPFDLLFNHTTPFDLLFNYTTPFTLTKRCKSYVFFKVFQLVAWESNSELY